MEKSRFTSNWIGRCILASWLLLPTMIFAAESKDPPTPTVTAKRAGRLLVLNCDLRDANGRKYQPNDRANPPQFAVYQGDTLVGSGTFEYG
jgi:hypothetical protein